MTGDSLSAYAGETVQNDTLTKSHLLDELVVTGQRIKIIGPGEARLYQYYDCNSTDFGTGYHRNCTLTLSYSFGFGKKVTPDQELNRSVYGNSAIMK